MTQSHPPSLLTTLARTLREECSLTHGASIVVALSGGTDSMALVHALSHLTQALKLRLTACGVDHGLRAAARAELDAAESFCATLGVPFARTHVQVVKGGNLQARARTARYAALEAKRIELGYEFIATAHHADDRAETVLLRLLRGAPPEGLAVLAPRSDRLLRPLIRVSKLAVCAYREHHGVPSALDPSNSDPRFLRTRVRTELMPLMQQLSPGIVGHLTALADELAQARLPALRDADGGEVLLNRGQRAEVRSLLRQKNTRARVQLSQGQVVVFDSQTGDARLVSEADLSSLVTDPGGGAAK